MSSLTHPEGAELLPVLVLRMANDLGVRALLIKGQVAALHQLRPAQLSNDVDILVEPAGFEPLRNALVTTGWFGVEDHVQPAIAEVKHSIALQHALWPLELDVHHSFPGMFAAPDDAFDALWDDRVDIHLAQQRLDAAGLAGSVILGLLHAWRNPGAPKAVAEQPLLEGFLSAADDELRASVSDLVRRVGAGEAGRDRWLALGVDPGPQTDVDPAQMLTWRMQTDTGRPLGWSYVLLQQPLWRAPQVFIRALLGTDEHQLRIAYPHAPAGRRGLWIIRWWRLKAAIRDTPRIVRLLRQHRQR